jgi:hypothetical protein
MSKIAVLSLPFLGGLKFSSDLKFIFRIFSQTEKAASG